MLERSTRAARAGFVASLGLLLGGCGALRPAPDPTPRVRGPLPSRAHQPLALTVMALRPRRAAVLEQGEWTLDARAAYASIEEAGSVGGTTAVFDGELARGSLALRYGLGEGTDVEVELGLLVTHRGFLDSFVEAWHRTFGLPGGGREQRPDDRHEMRLERGGEVLYELEEGRLGVGDVPIVLTRRILGGGPDELLLAGRVGVELPVGSESRGFGNGEFDLGAGLVAERSAGRWTLFGNADLVLPGQPDRFRAAGIELERRLSLGLGLECRWSERTSLLAQATWISRLTGNLEPEEIAREIFDFGVGLARDVSPRSRWTLSFHEDLVAATGSDFKVLFAWTYGR